MAHAFIRYALEYYRTRDEGDAYRVLVLQCIGGKGAVDVWLSVTDQLNTSEDGRDADEIVGDVVARAGLVMEE